MKKNIILTICFIFCLGIAQSYAYTPKEYYGRAVKAAKGGQQDFAFMNYKNALKGELEGKYKSNSLFALGEYQYMSLNYKESEKHFQSYLDYESEPIKRLFAYVYLYKIAKHQNDEELLEKIDNSIKTQKKVSFIFENKKEFEYISPLNNEHRAIYSIDKISFKIEGVDFEEIAY